MRKKALTMLLVCLCLCTAALAEELFIYGQSYLGRDLVCVRIGEESASESLLISFAVHGFEGESAHDGRYLVQIAEKLIAHYDAHPQELCGHALYVLPCVNPDGVEEGVTEDGFGRMNAQEIDINRDFDSDWQYRHTARYRTGDSPFATPEARAVRDLMERLQPDCGVDVHGWINGVYGSKALAECFQNAFGFRYRTYRSGGKLSQWMADHTEAAVLVELPSRPSREGYVETNAQKLIQALNEWFARGV